MEKERKVKTLSLVALIVAVLGLTVAFAALSQTLTINGTASVDAATWDVHITDLEKIWVEGSAKVISEPTIGSDGVSIENFKVSLSKPGDSVKYVYKVVNDGTVDVVLSSRYDFDYSDPGMFDNIEEGSAEYEALENEYLSKVFPEADFDGDGVTTKEERIKASEVFNIYNTFDATGGHVLLSGKQHSFDIEIWYASDADVLPKGSVIINLDEKLVYTQK